MKIQTLLLFLGFTLITIISSEAAEASGMKTGKLSTVVLVNDYFASSSPIQSIHKQELPKVNRPFANMREISLKPSSSLELEFPILLGQRQKESNFFEEQVQELYSDVPKFQTSQLENLLELPTISSYLDFPSVEDYTTSSIYFSPGFFQGFDLNDLPDLSLKKDQLVKKQEKVEKVEKVEEKKEKILVAKKKDEIIDCKKVLHCVENSSKTKVTLYTNKKVKQFIKLYSKRRRSTMARGIRRSSEYIKMAKRVFKEHGLPEDLVYLAGVESNFNPKARSWASAVGMWQFIPGTGKIYDLRQNKWQDDRVSPAKATVAAARFLRDLFRQFKNWEHALAAYNSGPGTVARAIRRAKKAKKKTDFWSLSLPRETRSYVPSFLAFSIVYKNMEKYGFSPVPAKKETPTQQIKVPGGVYLDAIAHIIKTDLKQLRKMNLELKKGITPITYKNYTLQIPKTAKVTSKQLTQIAKSRKIYWKTHKIVSGDTLWEISRKYRVSMSKIIKMNRLNKRAYLKLGRRLMLPIPGKWTEKAPKKKMKPVLAKSTRKKEGKREKQEYIHHKVKKGENLWKIAKKYGISFKSLLALNSSISRHKILKIGTTLKIPVGRAS